MDIKDYFKDDTISEIPIERFMELREDHLEDLYDESSDNERVNIFFDLLHEYNYLKNLNERKETAHICYLISYYIFFNLKPNWPVEIAMKYAKKAIYYNDILGYHEWIAIVKRGI